MSRLTDLLQKVSKLDPSLGAALSNEYQAVINSRNYGLVFEKHQPEAVELPSVTPSRGSTVRILPPRGESDMSKADPRLWTVKCVTSARGGDVPRRYTLIERGVPDVEREVREDVPGDELIVVSEFQDTIYPGLVETDSVINAGDADKPAHVVLNSENYHALELLSYTHRHAVDVIYIDPPYNTGAKDWKYNNDYVGSDDVYRHSKWLSFMDRRLKLAKELLNPTDSVLIVTIDEKEYLRLGLLLEQIFPEAQIQMISSVINPKGVARAGFSRVDEYVFFVMLGTAHPKRLPLEEAWDLYPQKGAELQTEPTPTKKKSPGWNSMMRSGSNSRRADRENLFYPIYADPIKREVVGYGEPIPPGEHKAPEREGLVSILPIRADGSEGRWQCGGSEMLRRKEQGRIRLGRKTSYGFVVNYLPKGEWEDIENGLYDIEGFADDGSIIAYLHDDVDKDRRAPSQWHLPSHNASENGSTLLRAFLPGRKFPFPKSLYAVEDTLRFFVKDKPQAVVLDFFAGSGTTAHAVMRLNKQDNGSRRSISVTNNEVSADEQVQLRMDGLRPGDPEWERWGICDYITKPRITAAITGNTPGSLPIKGTYKFTDEFPMSEGFPENARFYTLTYLSPNVVAAGRAFRTIAPMLWLAAGQQGRVIDDLGEQGWDATDYYGVVEDIDNLRKFVEAVNSRPMCRSVFIVTDDDGAFELAAQAVRDDMKTYRLYESYLNNFEIVNR